jgi:hypothetical protein
VKKILLAAAFLTAATLSASAEPCPWCGLGPGGGVQPHNGLIASGGAAATTGFVGFVGALVVYDIARRWTCMGDPLHLGGPGFSTRHNPASTIKPPPACR